MFIKMFLLKLYLLGVIINKEELCTLQVIKANVGLTRCQLMVPHKSYSQWCNSVSLFKLKDAAASDYGASIKFQCSL